MRHASHARRALFASLLVEAATLASPAAAQQTTTATVPVAAADTRADSDDAAAPGDVVVTAQRRSERLRDVPIAITAVTADEIDQRNVTDLEQLQATVPGLRLVDIGPGSQRIQLRGISQYQGLPTVGNYLDEFSLNPFGASGVAQIQLIDVERVEVLRGPQPVLYGEGAMGGSIRYITAMPVLDRVLGNAQAEISSVEDGQIGFRAQGALNVPLVTDKVGLRIAGAQERRGGWIDGPLGNDRNGENITTGRATLLIKPDDRLTISLLGLYNRSRQNVKSYSDASYRTAQIVPSLAEQRYGLGILDIAYDVGPVMLRSITGYLDQHGRSIDDSARFYNQLFGAPLLLTATTDAVGRLKKWSEEVRLTSNGAGPFRYLLGASYTDGRTTGTNPGNGVSLVPGLPASALGVVFTFDSRLRSKSWAFFGQASYELLPRLTVEAGGRYFIDDRRQFSNFTLIGLPVPPSIADQQQTFRTFNPRVSLTFKTSGRGNVYVSAARGFRSGGFNGVTGPGVPATFGPENIWTYEVGTKQSLIGDTLYVDTSFYYQDYRDIQANTLVNPTVATVVNSGRARGPGFDISFVARPASDFSVAASFGYNRVRFTTTTVDRLKGDPPDFVPPYNWSVATDWTPRLSASVRLNAHADLNFIDKSQIAIRSQTFTQTAFSQARTLLNTRLGIGLDDVEFYGFVSNLLNETAIINPPFGAFFEPTYTRPRTIGAGLRASF